LVTHSHQKLHTWSCTFNKMGDSFKTIFFGLFKSIILNLDLHLEKWKLLSPRTVMFVEITRTLFKGFHIFQNSFRILTWDHQFS
jgi:hypothetical protein